MTGWEDVRMGTCEDGRMANGKRRRLAGGRMVWDEGRIKFLQSA